jgi:hypothetical protein
MLKKTITRLLSVPDVNIFDGCIEAIEIEHGKPVTNLSDLKKREDKKKKGDVWELFCKDWLLASDKYKNVWLFQEWIRYCSEKQCSTKGLKSKQDNGIDIIAEVEDGTFVAIQCKYRKDKKKVTWNSLSTFIGLCERTGPWDQYIVMTNGSGVTRKVPKSKKDKSICIGTFRGTPRIQWLKMAGLFEEKTIENVSEGTERTEGTEIQNRTEYKQEIPDSNLQGTIHGLIKKYAKPKESQPQITSRKKMIQGENRSEKIKTPSLEELREIRVKKFVQDKIE